jgi:hypothetical protein
MRLAVLVHVVLAREPLVAVGAGYILFTGVDLRVARGMAGGREVAVAVELLA